MCTPKPNKTPCKPHQKLANRAYTRPAKIKGCTNAQPRRHTWKHANTSLTQTRQMTSTTNTFESTPNRYEKLAKHEYTKLAKIKIRTNTKHRRRAGKHTNTGLIQLRQMHCRQHNESAQPQCAALASLHTSMGTVMPCWRPVGGADWFGYSSKT